MEHKVVEVAPPGPLNDPLRDWPEELRTEIGENAFNSVVGTVLVSEIEFACGTYRYRPEDQGAELRRLAVKGKQFRKRLI